ncbi:hypothetical protein B0H34DRAFT_322003 [Crassisporium funariophilum]|nr:hypothetical protein B0H34DRAFT_322003 [Crassisporium funariophilum]
MRTQPTCTRLLATQAHFIMLSSEFDKFSRSETLRGGCLVGHIAPDKLDWLKTRLQGVTIVYNDPEFDCQTWVLDALRFIRDDEGVEVRNTNEERIRKELALEKERWDSGEDTIENRLFAHK